MKCLVPEIPMHALDAIIPYSQILTEEAEPPKEEDCSPKSLGCWKDNANRAIAGGIRFNSNNPIEDCHNYAKEQGFSVFAVQYNTECFTAANAAETFKKYGESSGCRNGRGGGWAQNVYQVTCEGN